MKSVFSKYLLAFLLIIAVSFAIIAGVMSSMVSGYSSDAKRASVENGARTITSFIEDNYRTSAVALFPQYVYVERAMLQSSMHLISVNSENMTIFVTDESGVILLSGDEDSGAVGKRLPEDLCKKILSSGQVTDYSDLGGAVDAKYLYSAMPLQSKDAECVGIVLVCSSSKGVTGLVETMMKTILASCLWVMIAAMLAVYFISEKISSPLKEMSRAAKQYAAGKFDVRVPVHGGDEVAELATAFNNMANSLANSEDLRRTFLANVSHDLRTPMTTIAGFIDGILDGAIPPEKQPYYLELIAGEVRRLSRLVSSLLDISRIQAGDRKFTKTTFDICEMARQILISFEQRIDEKKLNIEFECDQDNMMVYADRDAIYQVLYNICDNAVKFSTPGGTYRITIMEKDKKTFVSVWNEGQGIPENELPYVFDRFYKSDKSRGLDKTGVGLGLYITKTIIDAHSEEIWVKSVYGQYCEFVFTLQSVVRK